MMKGSGNIYKLLALISLLFGTCVASPADEEVEVILQFFEFELEDICTLKSEALWNFLSGNKTDLKQLLDLELKEAELYKNETKMLREFAGKTFSDKRLQRLFDIFSYPGAPLLGYSELKEYKEYSIKLAVTNSKMTIGCTNKDESKEPKTNEINEKECAPKNARKVNEILAKEKDEKKLKVLWSQWFEELNNEYTKIKVDFMQQLSILDMEAELNEEDDLSDYWLKQSDITDLDYQKISNLWKEIIPLYQKLRKYMAVMLKESYGSNAFVDNKLFPLHLLGSLKPESWIVTAEKLGGFNNAEPYKSLKSKLSQKKLEDLYRMADNFTSEVKIGDLPPEFFTDSLFNVTAPVCQDRLFDYCARKNIYRAILCSDEEVSLTRFVQVHENVAKLKHLILAGREAQEEENGFLFTEGPRDSVIYEAVAGLSSLIAVRPKNLRRQKLLPEGVLPNEEILSLLISALHIIPSLPYYLAADLWRINALKEIDASTLESTYEPSTTTTAAPFSSSTTVEEGSIKEVEKRDASEEEESSDDENETEADEKAKTAKEIANFSEATSTVNETYVTQATILKIYDFDNLTADWWKYREQLQGVGNSNGKLYPDFLQDEKIIWNKPYVSKFLGKIVQFQLLEYFRRENFTTNIFKIQTLLGKGKSMPYQDILAELFNITEISTKPLLTYFKPLEDFLDAGASFLNKTSEGHSDDLNLFSQSYSMNVDKSGTEVQKSSSTIAFSLIILTALGIIVITVFVGLKRHRKNKRAKERRKRLNQAENQ